MLRCCVDIICKWQQGYYDPMEAKLKRDYFYFLVFI